MTSYVRAPLTFAAHQRATVGDQKISFTSFDHLGWMKCDGRAVSRTTYALLFNVINTTFGAGNGSTTFNLPNFSGCVPGMSGQPPFTAPSNPTTYTRGQVTGEQQHQLIINEMPAHKHGSVDVSGNTNGNGNTTSNGKHDHNKFTGDAGRHSHPARASSEGAHTHTTNSQNPPQHNHGGFTGEGGYEKTQHDVRPDTFAEKDDTADNVGSHTHTISNDGAHTHTTDSQGSHTHTITVDEVLDHKHSILEEPDHHHTMGTTGGSAYHNNMQPTLFSGNMYIFSGRMWSGVGTYPFTTGTDLA